ncbi:MAG: type II toxin-antitoxin system VapB family antitoxin [Thermodesulfobacteriota bacterium]
MTTRENKTLKTTIILDKDLLGEVDRYNPFSTRKAFIDEACKTYIAELKRKQIDQQLEAACAEAASEDMEANDEWEAITLEGWK